MNLQELALKLKRIDEGGTMPPLAPTKDNIPADTECGPMPGMMVHAEQPKQQDNVTMNVSMNGSGAGGISDLMKILRNIEASNNRDIHQHDVGQLFGEPHTVDHEEPIMGDIVKHMADMEGQSDASPLTHEYQVGETIDDDEESWGNSLNGASGHHTHGIDAVTFSGDDMNSKGKSSPVMRVPGSNTLREPTNVSESLINRLSEMYAAIKEDPLNPETDAQRRKREFDEKIRKNDQKFVKNVKRRSNVPQHEKDTAARIEKRLKGEKISEWGVNLTQPNSDLFGSAPANFNDKANVNALTAKYDDLIKHTQQEIDKLKANPTGPGSDSLINTLQQQIKGLEAEKLHNMTGASNDDASNALRKQAIANNELTPGQWLQKATQYFKGKVTGKPQPGVSYDRYDTSHQAEKDWTTPTPFKPGTGLEESAKWRDPKYKGKLFTQKKGDSDDYDSIDYGYGIKERPKKDPGQKRSTFDRDTVWTDPLDTRSNLPKDHNDPENWGYGSISSKGDSKGKLTADRRKRMKNDIRGSLGQHHTPSLPEQMNESKELNAMLALNKRLNG